jgi:hypothetical protein
MKVPFHGTELLLVEQDGEPFIPMKPLVAAIGLGWQAQFEKLKANKSRWGIRKIQIPSYGGEQATLCMPVRKLLGWLATLEPGRIVSPVIRERVVRYQEECDDVLWNSWRKSLAINQRRVRAAGAKSTIDDRADALRLATELVIDRRVPYSSAYRVMQFYVGARSFRAMTCDQAVGAAEFAGRLLLHLDTAEDWKLIEQHQSGLQGGPMQLSLNLHPRLSQL